MDMEMNVDYNEGNFMNKIMDLIYTRNYFFFELFLNFKSNPTITQSQPS